MLTARAVARHGAPPGYVDLVFDETGGCPGCSGVCMWRRLRARQARLAVPTAVAPGAVVTVSLPERSLLLASCVLHGLPWVTLLAGATVGGVIFGSDWGVLAGASVALVSLAVFAPIVRRRVERATLAQLRVEALR